VYPNPSTGTLNINIPNKPLEKGDKIRVTDISGKLLKEFRIETTTTRFEIDLKNILVPDTPCFISVITKLGTHTRKVIKK
jgi:broad specificity polyphosphatase/5'/3'-nucleotidase SurE